MRKGFLVQIRTGSNQRYIFDTNRRRLNVGASDLIARLPEWVEAAGTENGISPTFLIQVSSVVACLVDSREKAERLIGATTQKALEEAPGLEVWGWHHELAEDETVAQALAQAELAMAQLSLTLTPTVARNPTFPFAARCRETGEPIEWQEKPYHFGPEEVQLSPRAGAQHRAAAAGLARIRGWLADESLSEAIVSEAKLDDGVTHNGWVAVVHADGNGFGALLANLALNAGETYEDDLRLLSSDLDNLGRLALRAAVQEIVEGGGTDPGWLLPLIAGGDDLTVICDARHVRAFTVAYLSHFQTLSGSSEAICRSAQKAIQQEFLTASAGIAYVKPTHPFSDAHRIAEELCGRAKTIKKHAHQSSFALATVWEAAGRRLEEVIGGVGASVFTIGDAPSGSSGGITFASSEALEGAAQSLASGTWSGSTVHRLRRAGVSETADTDIAILVSRLRLSADEDERTSATDVQEWWKDYRVFATTAADTADMEWGLR